MRETHIFLCDVRRQTPEHDGLTLLVLPSFPSVVLVWVVAIGVVPIFWPVTVSSLPLPLLLVNGNIQHIIYFCISFSLYPVSCRGGGTYLWAVSGSSTIVKSIISSLVTPAAHVISLLVSLSSVTPVGIVTGLVGPVPPASFRAADPAQRAENTFSSTSFRERRGLCTIRSLVCIFWVGRGGVVIGNIWRCDQNDEIYFWYSRTYANSLQISDCADKPHCWRIFILNFAPSWNVTHLLSAPISANCPREACK